MRSPILSFFTLKLNLTEFSHCVTYWSQHFKFSYLFFYCTLAVRSIQYVNICNICLKCEAGFRYTEIRQQQAQINRIKTRKYKIRYSVRLSNTTYYGAKWMLFDFFGKLRNDDDLLGKKPSWIGVTKGGIFYFGLIVTHCQSYHPIVSKCFIKNFSLQMTQFLRWNLSDGSSEVNHHIIPDVFHTILGPAFWHHLYILLSGVKRNALQSERFNIPLLLRRSVQRSWRLQLFIQVRIPSF